MTEERVHVDVAGEEAGLRPAAIQGPVFPYLKDLWGRRQYMRYVAANQLRAQRINTVLGNVWHLLNPTLQITVTYIIFGLVLKVDRGVENFISFLAVGIFPFQYSTRATMMGARSIVGNAGLMKSFAFPRAMLPVTSSITATLTYLPTLPVMFAVALIVGEDVRLSWLALPAVVAVQTVFNLGAAFVAARMTFHLRDVEQVLPFVFRLLFYASGVIFLVDAWVQSQYRWMFIGNPLYCIVALYRWSVLGLGVDTAAVVSALVWMLMLPVIGFWWFRRGELLYGNS